MRLLSSNQTWANVVRADDQKRRQACQRAEERDNRRRGVERRPEPRPPQPFPNIDEARLQQLAFMTRHIDLDDRECG